MISEDELGVVESFGKFSRVVRPGPLALNMACGVATESLRSRVTTRITQHVVRSETKTKDNVFCVMDVSVQYRLNLVSREESAVQSVYKVADFRQLMTEQVQDHVRTKLSKLDLDRAFLMRHELQADMAAHLGARVAEYGYEVVKVLITHFAPARAVAEEMNNIYTQTLKKQVTAVQADTRKMVQVILAEADSERKELVGKGVSLMRRVYLHGMEECLDDFVKVATPSRPILPR